MSGDSETNALGSVLRQTLVSALRQHKHLQNFQKRKWCSKVTR